MTCTYCDGTGIYKKPKDQDKFEREYDRLDQMGCFDSGQAYKMALNESGYDEVKCTKCQ